ncbi:BON domain-containing protein [Nonomuraea fuscirosea]|jgi:CBS-domain-containing membrane protein|uniref:BON domain-containing protein n=1 Tax=Nonomuraea fuscirosea TaxID=1291556 RepID=UPI00343B7927
MHEKRVKRLPVIDPVTGRIAGTLHQRDVLRVFTRPEHEPAADVDAALTGSDGVGVRIDRGVVTLTGEVATRSWVIALTEAVRAVEGVIDVVCEAAVRSGRSPHRTARGAG